MRFIPKIWYALVAVALLHGAALAASFTASLDRDSITTGESATLSLTFEGGTPRTVPTPGVSGLQINQVGNSQSYSIINGAMSATVTVTFSVTAQRPGEYTIPALTADVGGQQLSTEPLKLTVGKIAAPSAEAVNSGNEVAFLKFSCPKQKMYAGESVVAHLDLYLRDEVQNFGNFAVTGASADGFSLGKCVELPNQRHRAQVGNRVYTIIPYAVPVTAVKTGSFALGPFTASVIIVLPNGWMGEQRQVTLATDSANVESLPLPEDKPAGFSGAIGNFTMTATAGPTTVTVGDPITVRVKISGRGSFDSLALPAQDAWQNFKSYPPTTKIETGDQFGLQGTKTFEQIISPLNTDVHELPPLNFAYFNPDDGHYHTLKSGAVTLTVQPAGSTPMPALAANKPPALENPDLRRRPLTARTAA